MAASYTWHPCFVTHSPCASIGATVNNKRTDCMAGAARIHTQTKTSCAFPLSARRRSDTEKTLYRLASSSASRRRGGATTHLKRRAHKQLLSDRNLVSQSSRLMSSAHFQQTLWSTKVQPLFSRISTRNAQSTLPPLVKRIGVQLRIALLARLRGHSSTAVVYGPAIKEYFCNKIRVKFLRRT